MTPMNYNCRVLGMWEACIVFSPAYYYVSGKRRRRSSYQAKLSLFRCLPKALDPNNAGFVAQLCIIITTTPATGILKRERTCQSQNRYSTHCLGSPFYSNQATSCSLANTISCLTWVMRQPLLSRILPHLAHLSGIQYVHGHLTSRLQYEK